MAMKLKDLINHTPAKLYLWHGKHGFQYDAYFPDKFYIEGEQKPTKEEAKASFILAWERGILVHNKKGLTKTLYPYWG